MHKEESIQTLQTVKIEKKSIARNIHGEIHTVSFSNL